MNYFDTWGERRIPTKKGDLVRSNGEAEIANLLWDKNIRYAYEGELLGVHPDFLVYTPDGKVCVWEYAGPGMLEQDDYCERLNYKLHLFKKLNPHLYKVVFSDDSVTSRYVLEEFILNKNSSAFFSSIEQATEEEFVRKVYRNLSKASLPSTSSINPWSFYDKQMNLNPSVKLWIIDTSFFYAYYDRNIDNCDVEDCDIPPCLKFYSSRSGIIRRDAKGYPLCFLVLREAWELDSLNEKLSWIDLSKFDESSTDPLPYQHTLIRCTKDGIYSTPSIDKFLHRHFGTSENGDSPEVEIQELLMEQPGKRSQIQLLIDTGQFEYSDIEKPYEHLKSIQQKTVKLPSESDWVFFTNRNSIVRFEIVFEDSPLYVDIYGRTKIDLETHIREIEIAWLKYDKDNQTWSIIPSELENTGLKVKPPTPNLQKGKSLQKAKNSQSSFTRPDSILPRRMNSPSKIVLPPTNPPSIFRRHGAFRREQTSQIPGLTSGTGQQAEQNAQSIGKNHAHNRRKKLIKRLKRALEAYPDLKAMFEAEVLPSDLEELTTIAKYYYLKIKYKNNQAL